MKAQKSTRKTEVFFPRNIETVLLAAGCIGLLFTLHPSISGDGLDRFRVVQALLNAENLPGVKYSLVQPLLSLPLAFLAKWAGLNAQAVVAFFNAGVFFILSCFLYRSLIAFFDCRRIIRFFMLLLSASMFPHALQQYNGEVLSALCVCTGFALAARNSSWAALLLALGIANTPPLLVPTALACVFLRQRRAVLGLGVGLGLVLILAENMVKFGSPLNASYLSAAEHGFATVLPYSGKPGFSYPLFFGVLSVLFSFGKGLVFFIPGVFLLLSQRVRTALNMSKATTCSTFTFCAAMVLVYAGWWAWYGGSCWGPRFFLILAVPASMALTAGMEQAKGLRWSALIAGVLALSTWVGINGVVFGQADMDVCWQNNYALECLCWYVPEFSALWRPFVVRGAGGVVHALLHDRRTIFFVWQITVLVYFFMRIAVLEVRNQRVNRFSSEFK